MQDNYYTLNNPLLPNLLSALKGKLHQYSVILLDFYLNSDKEKRAIQRNVGYLSEKLKLFASDGHWRRWLKSCPRSWKYVHRVRNARLLMQKSK